MVLTANRAAEICREWYVAFRNKGKGEEKCVLELLDAADTIEALEAAEPKWISVEEQPPVLGCLIYDGVNPPNKCLQLWTIESNGRKVYFDKNPLDLMDALGVHVKDIDGITHIEYWMPMPKVPKHIKKMIKLKRRKKNMTPEPPKEEA